jgi:hypothetical protein
LEDGDEEGLVGMLGTGSDVAVVGDNLAGKECVAG